MTKMSTDSSQSAERPTKFTLGPLGNLNQVTKALGKTIRAMADGSIDSQVGARICNGLGIMRQALETVKLEDIETRLSDIEGTATHVSHATDNRQAYRAH